MTAAGESVRTAASGAVEKIRARMAEGVTAEEYRLTVEVLACMSANLSPPMS